MFRFSRAPLTWALLGLVLVGSGVAAQAPPEPLFATNGAGKTESTLYSVDRGTGAATAIGVGTGYTHVTALDFDPTTGVLYGIGQVGENPSLLLLTIDTTTGVGAAIANVFFLDVCVVPDVPTEENPPDRVPDMSFNASGTLYVWREPCDDLYTVNKLDGVATRIDEAGLNGSTWGLAFDSDDTLHLKYLPAGSSDYVLTTVSVSSGVTSPDGVTVAGETQNMLAIDENDVLYSGNRLGSADSELVTISLSGVVTTIGNTGIAQLAALAFEPTALPEPELPSTKAQCEKGGWQRFGIYKNQGDCVSFVATQGTNGPFAATKSSRSNR